MTQAFLQIAIPVLYVYDEGVSPQELPGFPMSILPVISRALKEHAGTSKLTVITGTPTPTHGLDEAFTHLALQYAHLEKASPEAGALLAAEFIAENLDAEAVLSHLQRIVSAQQKELAEDIERRFGKVEGETEGEITGVPAEKEAPEGTSEGKAQAEETEPAAEAEAEVDETDEDGEDEPGAARE